MPTILVHISDFHNKNNNFENHPVLVNAFFEDLKTQLELIQKRDVFLVFSGDVAQAGDDIDQYNDFVKLFDEKLSILGMPKARRICVPGNHDLSRNFVKNNYIEHEGVVGQKLNEKQFNDYISKPENILIRKFDNYLKFQNSFANYGLDNEKISGAGWDINANIGIYCLNSAICSSGGLEVEGKPVKDERRLRVDTRSLHKWIQDTTAKHKILVMHHPLHWLDEDSEKELKVILKNNFSLRLCGHTHEQDSLHTITQNNSLIECCAPALFSRKSDLLGYSIIAIDAVNGVREIIYRQWTKYQSFVSGTGFSNTDTGKVIFRTNLLEQATPISVKGEDAVLNYLNSRFDKSLISYNNQPKIWVNPVIKNKPEVEQNADSTENIDVLNLIENPKSSVINASPQFGLTCLAFYLIKNAWASHSDLWIYLDASLLKPNSNSIRTAIATELGEIGISNSEIKCIVVDSIGTKTKDSWKIVSRIIEIYPKIPIICMATFDIGIFGKQVVDIPDFANKFETLYLWTLSRNLIRTIVTEYNGTRYIGDDSTVINRIVADLEMLNLHRTPLNCLTLLKVSELDFDESPVNRSEMIKRVLFLLFNVDSVPTYKTRPDLKDCEFVLGYFCETLLRENVYTFTRHHFLNMLQKCCKDQLIDLEIDVVFDVLNENNIIVQRESQFIFKFSFWIYYFAALRMYQDKQFEEFIFTDMRYANHPELIEFYTGIDRQRDNALLVLQKDLALCREQVADKCGFPKELDPYRLAQWTPSESAIQQMEDEISSGVRESNLPDEIKDSYTDSGYDPIRPYNQSINVLTDHSFVYLTHALRAASKALRNSDYVSPILKTSLLKEILHSWEQISIVLLVVMPTLANDGHAVFDGANFILNGSFSNNAKERMHEILMEIPSNVVRWSQDDLMSQKMSPLLLSVFESEAVALRKHELALLLIIHKPKGWIQAIKNYISEVQKNSFYLLNIYRSLRTQYQYSYVSKSVLIEIEYLIKMAATKHVTGTKSPGIKLIQKMASKISTEGESVIPQRDVLPNDQLK